LQSGALPCLEAGTSAGPAKTKGKEKMTQVSVTWNENSYQLIDFDREISQWKAVTSPEQEGREGAIYEVKPEYLEQFIDLAAEYGCAVEVEAS
jgi:hypothetical protein